ncbi:asparaginase [Gordonia sp. CPCC 206044]|uniref:asparaginase n=1 Tax=Gordonia sp. CPCC 206044 TaxID=3140793 RepID=UPI003AF332AB
MHQRPATDPHIVLISTGGTIAAHSTADGTVPRLTAADLIGTGSLNTGSLSTEPRIIGVDLMSVDSSAMSVADQFAIAAAVVDALTDPATIGVVVTHGTDTMEETSYLTDLFVADDRPVVFTGAQHPADSALSDGPANLAAALRLVTEPNSRGRGVLVAMAGEVRSARGIFKSSTTDLDAFDTVHGDLPRHTLDRPVPRGRPARVDALALYPGVSPGLIAAAVAQQSAGIVLAATGSGNAHPDITAEVIAAVRAGVVVVVTSRVPHGEVVPAYGGGGGAVDLERAGAIVSRWLRAPQARIAVSALLSTGASVHDVRAFFCDTTPTT